MQARAGHHGNGSHGHCNIAIPPYGCIPNLQKEVEQPRQHRPTQTFFWQDLLFVRAAAAEAGTVRYLAHRVSVNRTLRTH
jgi:hypothetical protein